MEETCLLKIRLDNQVHADSTRQAEQPHVISYNTNVRALKYIFGVKRWNHLSLDPINNIVKHLLFSKENIKHS